MSLYLDFFCWVNTRFQYTIFYLPDIKIKLSIDITVQIGFVCVEVLRPSQPNGVMSSAVSLPKHTFTGQA